MRVFLSRGDKVLSTIMGKINQGALALQSVKEKYQNLPTELIDPFTLSKTAPYFGFVDIQITGCAPFVMFSNNDDYVAKNYFWRGTDAYEPMSLKVWTTLAKKASFVLDIGSYTGLYSLAAAFISPKSKIYSFEGLDVVYSRLLVNKVANNTGNLNAYHLAISDKEGVAEFNSYAGDTVLSTGSSLITKNVGRSIFQKKLVRTACLDTLLVELSIPSVDLIKIDAEGAEHLIFLGAQQVLNKYSPDIICEFLTDAETNEIEKTLTNLGYRYFHINEKNMTIRQTSSINSADNMESLNTLITKKTIVQLEELLKDNTIRKGS